MTYLNEIKIVPNITAEMVYDVYHELEYSNIQDELLGELISIRRKYGYYDTSETVRTWIIRMDNNTKRNIYLELLALKNKFDLSEIKIVPSPKHWDLRVKDFNFQNMKVGDTFEFYKKKEKVSGRIIAKQNGVMKVEFDGPYQNNYWNETFIDRLNNSPRRIRKQNEIKVFGKIEADKVYEIYHNLWLDEPWNKELDEIRIKYNYNSKSPDTTWDWINKMDHVTLQNMYKDLIKI